MNIHEIYTKHKELYLFELEDNKVLFKVLGWAEFKNFAHLFLNYPKLESELEDIVWDLCVIEHNQPVSLEYIDAGIVSAVVFLIMHFSGCTFSSEDDLTRVNEELESARSKTTSIEEQIKIVICEAFPSYKPEDLDKLSWSEIIERVAQAEVLLKKKFQLTLTQQEQVQDDSKQVFDMLDRHSMDHQLGVDIDKLK